MKESYFFDRLARIVASHPKLVLTLLVVVSALLAWQLRYIEADPSPQALLASADPEQQKLEDEARRLFGSTDNVVVLVISGRNAVDKSTLDYAHKLSTAMTKLPHVVRVDALTRQSWPKPNREEATLDDLSATTEDDAPESGEELAAAADLVAAVPSAFPDGLATLSERSADKHLEPLVAGPEVTDEDVTLIDEVLENTKVLDGRLVSRDRKHLLVAVQFSDARTKHVEMAEGVESIEHWLEKNTPPGSVKVSLSGLPVIRTSLVRHMRADQGILIPGTLFASFMVLALSFRWAPAVVLPLISVAITALWLVGGMALFREPLNVLNNMLPALVIIIGLNEAVHIIGRYTEECRSDNDKVRALGETVRAMGAACLTTTATSAVGLLALLVSRTEMLRRFGMVGAAGLFLAYGVTLLVVPSVLSLLHAPPVPEDPTRERKRGLIEKIMSITTSGSLRRPWLVLTFALVSAVVAGWTSSKVRVDTSLLDQFATDDPVFQAVQLLEKEFEGVRPLDVTLTSAQPGRMFQPELLLAMHRVTDWAAKQPAVLSASDVTEPLAGTWAALSGRPMEVRDALQNAEQTKALAQMLTVRDPRILHPFLTPDGQRTRIRIKLTDVGSAATKEFVERVRTTLTKELSAYPDVKASFGGDAYLSSRGLDAVVADLSGSVILAALVIFALLAVLLRDFKLALLAIPANLLPQVWTMAWMVARGISLSAATAIIFSLSIGLAVDGSIHLVSRFQEERAHGILTTSALVRAVRGSGRNIVVSACALLLGFSAILLSNFVPVQRFAELIIVSMTGSVFATLIIQPVLIRVFLAHRSRRSVFS